MLSWTLGNVIHMDAQSALAVTSDGQDRVSPDLKLSNQWDFDGLKFGDSATISFNLPENVASLRIEYLLKSDVVAPTNVNFKLNNLDTIIGIGKSENGDAETISVLVTNPKRLDDSIKAGKNALKQTIATDGATVQIERIRLSYYRPDPIVIWEFDSQLTRASLKGTTTEVVHGSVPVSWEILSGKPIDISVLLKKPNFVHGSTGGWLTDDAAGGGRFSINNFDFKKTVGKALPIDHGVGDGRHGNAILSIDVTDRQVINQNTPNSIGVFLQPVSPEGGRLIQRAMPMVIDDVQFENLVDLQAEHAAGVVIPANVTEADAIGFAKLPAIPFGSGEFEAMLAHLPDNSYQGTILFADDLCKFMLQDVMSRLRLFADLGDYHIKVTKAWIPQATTDDEWAHTQGRAINFIPVDKVSGNPKPEFLSRLAAAASYAFDYVHHVPANATTGDQAYIHASRRFEVPTLGRILNFRKSEVANNLANAHWDQVADFNDPELLDQLILRFPGTDVSQAALSYRYDLVLKLSDDLLASELRPDQRAKWEAESAHVIYASHDFLQSFPGTPESERTRLRLFSVLRRLEDAYEEAFEFHRSAFTEQTVDPAATEEQSRAARDGLELLKQERGIAPDYHNFALHYPACIEGRLAFARLYLLEAKRTKAIDSTVAFLSFMRDYPDAPQWTEMAQLAREKSVADETAILFQLKARTSSDADFEEAKELRAAILFRNDTQRIMDQLKEIFKDKNFTGIQRRETSTAYEKPHLARFLVESMERKKHVAGALQAEYLDLFAELGNAIGDFENQEKLVEISLQIQDLSDLVKKNHSDVISVVKIEEQKTRSAMRSQISGLTGLVQAQFNKIQTEFNKIQLRFDSVDQQLEDIYQNTDAILENQEKIIVQLDAIEQSLVEIIDQNDNLAKQVAKINSRTSGGSSRSGGLFGGAQRWISGASQRLTNSITAELGNLTKENLERWMKDPGGTVRKRFEAGKVNLKVEVNRGVAAAKSSWWYKKMIAAGKHLLLEDPGNSMEEFDPEPPFDPTRHVYFVNGVNNTLNEARKHAQFLADLQNVRVKLIYNHSNSNPPRFSTVPPGSAVSYGDSDLLECFYDKLWPIAVLNAPFSVRSLFLSKGRVQENPAARHLAHQIFHEAENDNDVRIVAHSQGTLICRNALLACELLRGKVSGVSCVLAGPALSDGEMLSPRKLANLTWIVNRRDPIAPLLGFKATIEGLQAKDGLSRDEHNFSNDKGNDHGGVTPAGKSTYVRMVRPEFLEPSNERGKTVFS